MEQNANVCPRCGGRLVSGSKNCLHCGALVAPGKSAAADDSGGGISMMTIIIIALVALGGIFFIVVGTGSSKAVDVVSQPVTFGSDGKGGSNVTSTVCVPESAEAAIDDMQSEGWEEIDPKRPGQRCFRD